MPLLFLHLPKTGGTSLVNNVLLPAVPFDRRYVEDDLVLRADCRDRPNRYGELIHLADQYRAAYADLWAAFVRSGLIPAGRALYSGHLGFGCHEALPGPARYLTLVREPVARVVSSYNLYRSVGTTAGTFAGYLDSGLFHARNLQVRMLCRDGFRAGPDLNRDHVAEAKANLRRWFEFAATDHLDGFARGLMARFGWRLPYTGAVHNRTSEQATIKGNPAARHVTHLAEPTAADRERALEANALDAELYQWARAESAARWGGPTVPTSWPGRLAAAVRGCWAAA